MLLAKLKVVVVVVFLIFSPLAFLYGQCPHSISSVSTRVESLKKDNSGVIEVSVSTSNNYICKLIIEKGAGPQVIATKRGKGDSQITFKELNTNQVYVVEFEFLSEETTICRKLQKSGIIIDAK